MQSVLALPALVEIHVLAAIRSNKTHHSPEVEHGIPSLPASPKSFCIAAPRFQALHLWLVLALLGYLNKTFRCQKKVGFLSGLEGPRNERPTFGRFALDKCGFATESVAAGPLGSSSPSSHPQPAACRAAGHQPGEPSPSGGARLY